MSDDDWKVILEFVDARSDKFWRGRVDGHTMYVNYGRRGTDGQTSIKEFDSAEEAEAALAKQVSEKRKKGYVDAGGAAPAKAKAAKPAAKAPSGPTSVTLRQARGGQSVTVRLTVDGTTLTTEVVEPYGSADDAYAAYERILAAMVQDGYSKEK